MDRISMITALFSRALVLKSIGGDSLKYIGVTTTALTDGATTNPITIDGDTVTATNGDVALYSGDAFVFNGTIWQASSAISQIFTEIGDLSDLDTEAKTDLVSAINEVNEEKQDDVELSLTPTAVVSDRDIQDGQGNTLSVLAEALTKTASGNPVLITDAAGGKARSLKTTINAIQDLHGYDKPWVGGAGKNKFGGGTFSDSLATHTFDVLTGTCKATATSAGDNSQVVVRFDNISALRGQTVTFSIKDYVLSNNNLKPYVIWYKDSGSAIANSSLCDSPTSGITKLSTSFIIPNDINYVLFLLRLDQNTQQTAGDYIQVNELQLEIGSSKTSFESYSNICPISGRTVVVVDDTGLNMWDATADDTVYGWGGTWSKSGQTYTCVASSSSIQLFSENGTATQASHAVSVEPNSNYCVSVSGMNVSQVFGVMYDKNKQFLRFVRQQTIVNNSAVIAVPSDAYYMGLRIDNNSATSGKTYNFNIQIEEDSTATPYEPYAHSSAIIQLGQTVYGADINWDTGVGIIKYAIIDLGSISYNKDGDNRYYHRFAAGYNMRAWSSSSEIQNNYCEIYKSIPKGNYDTKSAPGITCTLSSGYPTIMIYDNVYNDTADNFKTYVSGKMFCYELATPTTIQLTPSQLELLKGYNRVTIEGGSIEIEYIAKAISGNDEEIAPLVGDKATKSYAVNDFIERADGLYRVTALIASGASFTANNTVKMSIGEALTYLYNK